MKLARPWEFDGNLVGIWGGEAGDSAIIRRRQVSKGRACQRQCWLLVAQCAPTLMPSALSWVKWVSHDLARAVWWAGAKPIRKSQFPPWNRHT